MGKDKKLYQARKNSSLKESDAQLVGETLNELRDNNGYLKTESVVFAAKSKSSILNKYFEWNNNKSAEKFRLQQARNLISSVVEIVIIQEQEVAQRSFHSVQTIKGEDLESEGKVYVTIQDAIENEDYRKHLLNKIITTLENLTTTMKMFKEHDTN
jgi:hypothetical protein